MFYNNHHLSIFEMQAICKSFIFQQVHYLTYPSSMDKVPFYYHQEISW